MICSNQKRLLLKNLSCLSTWVILCSAVILLSAPAVFGAGVLKINVPNGHVYWNNGDFITTPFIVNETGPVTANFVTMNCLDDNGNDAGSETFEVAITLDIAGNNAIATAQISNNFRNTGGCDEHKYSFDFADVTLNVGTTYYLRTKVLAGAEVRTWAGAYLYYDGGTPFESRKHVDVPGGHNNVLWNNGNFITTAFSLDNTSVAKFATMNCLDDNGNDAGDETFEVAITTDKQGSNVITKAQITNNFRNTGGCDEHMYLFDFRDNTLLGGTTYYLRTKVLAGAEVRTWNGADVYYTESTVPEYMKIAVPPDVDKSAHGHVGSPTCWLATAANMLAGAGYGTGLTIQARADNIYSQLVNHYGTATSGWTDTALNWWLGSTNNPGGNPYAIVTVYGNKSPKNPWANPNGAQFMGNELRRCQLLGLSISWPTADASIGTGGHAITGWGDSGTAAPLTSNPARVKLTDSDRDNGGDIQTYTYDGYTNPNPGGSNEGNGWYFNYSANHPYIKHIVTLCPTDVPVPNDVPGPKDVKRAIGSYKIRQPNTFEAIGLHYKVGSDAEILSYKTAVDMDVPNSPVIGTDAFPPLELTVDWDMNDNPLGDGGWIKVITDLVLKAVNMIEYSDIYFRYDSEPNVLAIPGFKWEVISAQLSDVNIPDITGGYVVGAFDIIAPDDLTLVGQYRFMHEYGFEQDPEYHDFILEGEPNMIGSYKADNLRFGHSYGVLDMNGLWEFDGWMTYYPGRHELMGSMIEVTLDWQGQLPYPQGENYLGEEYPVCVDYLPQDLNMDCTVNFVDFAIFADKWLQTAP
ncbi:MAG: hypothetical protein ABIG61_05950 [Planctomycetota bacterium]